MSSASPLKHGFVDLAAVLFAIGGVVSFMLSVLTIPISSIYPLTVPATFTTGFLAVLALSLICSIGTIHCYSLTTRRMLSEAGIRGTIFGALLLILSLFAGAFGASTGTGTPSATSPLAAISAFLILLGGIICFVMRHTTVSASAIARERAIAQPLPGR